MPPPFTELVRSAELIVVAKVIAVREEPFNQARNPQDPSQPAVDIVQPAVVYALQVEQYWKGMGESTLYLVQAEKILLPQEADTANAVVVSDVTPPLQVNARYVLFLRRLEMPYPDVPAREWVGDVVEPYRFRLEGELG